MTRSARKRLGIFILTVIVLAAVVLFGAVVWLAHDFALRLIYTNHTYPADTPSAFGFKNWEDVRFKSSDGLTLAGWFIPPASASDGATIVYTHGLSSNRGDLLPQAALLAKQGYGALLIDLRNSGASEGTMTTLGYKEPLDVAAAVAYLLTRSDVNHNRIALVGVSLGAASSIRAAAAMPQVQAVVSESGFSSVEDNVAEGVRRSVGLPPFPFAPLIVFFAGRELGQDLNAVRPIDDVGKIAPRALLLIHGSDDSLIDVSNSQRLYTAAAEPKQLWIVPGGHHGDLLTVAPQEFEQHIVEFLNQYLRAT